MSPTTEKTVLVIEDDRNTAALVAVYLRREGFRVVTAGDGESGLAAAERRRPDLVILDLMLPKTDGWEVGRRLRQKSEVPIIMLTARGEEIDRVAGLTLGADDYVVKPFSPRELVARVKAVLRRAPRRTPAAKRFYPRGCPAGPGKASAQRGRPAGGRHPARVRPIGGAHVRPGSDSDADELLARLYPQGEAVVIERVVDVHIGKLRQKIEMDPSAPRYILTARGIGYKFAEGPPPDTGISR